MLHKSTKNCLKENELIKFSFICDKKEIINSKKIQIELIYYIKDKKYENLYQIIPYEFPKGEELSKLIIYDNILKNPKKIEENLSNALKYQIFYENTSIYADLELSDKIQDKLKLKLIGNKENNVIKLFRKKEIYGKKCEKKKKCQKKKKRKKI